MRHGDRFAAPDSGHEAVVPFRVDVQRDNARTVVAPVGEIDLLNARVAYDRVMRESHDALAELVIDFTGVTFIDSTGLAALVKAARRLDSAGVNVRISNPSPHALRVMKMTGVDRTISISEAP